VAIIDTFIMLFRADTSNVKKGVDESEKDLKRLEAEAKKADAEVSKIGKSFLSATSSLAGLVAGFVGAHAVISGFRESLSYTTDLSNASRELHVNVSALDAWGQAVKRVGGTSEGFRQSLKGLSEHIGASPERALQVLPRLADAMSKMGNFQAQRFGKMWGLDQSTILLLQQGRREVEDMIKQQERLGVVTEKDVIATRNFNNAVRDAGQAYNTFWRELSTPIMPYLTDTIKYLLDHQDLVKGAFVILATGATGLVIAFTPFIGTITLLAGAVALLSIAYEDFQKFREGMPSITEFLSDQSISHGIGKFIPQSVKDTYEKAKPYFTDKAVFGYLGFNSNTQSAGNSNQNTNITVGDVFIDAKNADAKQVGEIFKNSITDQYMQANNHFATGGV